MLSSKNAMLSTAAADLGLGDQLQNQVQNELAQRKKKLQQSAGLGMSSAMTGGPATQSLFSAAGGFNG